MKFSLISKEQLVFLPYEQNKKRKIISSISAVAEQVFYTSIYVLFLKILAQEATSSIW